MGPMCVRNSEVEALHVQGSAVIDRRYNLDLLPQEDDKGALANDTDATPGMRL
jgi:hypothetical protein